MLTACAAPPWSSTVPTHSPSPAASPSPTAPIGHVTLFPLAPGVPAPNRLVAGLDGNLWFTAFDTVPSGIGAFGDPVHDAIGRMTLSGTFTVFPLPWPGSLPDGIVPGRDGNFWFTENLGDAVGRVTPKGAINDYLVPPRPHRWLGDLTGGQPHAIAVGPDGNLWVADDNRNDILRLTPSGALTTYPLPAHPGGPAGGPYGIVAGPDGALWFTELSGRIGRITTHGRITEYLLPGVNHTPMDMVVGGDGALWFLEPNQSLLGHITTAGHITEFPVPHPPCYEPGRFLITTDGSCNTWFLSRGPDGLIWLSESWRDALARIDGQGRVTEFPLPPLPPLPYMGRMLGRHRGGPGALALGPDGALWFTYGDGMFTYGEGIGRFSL